MAAQGTVTLLATESMLNHIETSLEPENSKFTDDIRTPFINTNTRTDASSHQRFAKSMPRGVEEKVTGDDNDQ